MRKFLFVITINSHEGTRGNQTVSDA